MHGRSNSAPGSSANQTPFERSIQEPISEPLILFSRTDLDIKKAHAKVDETRDCARSQSAAEHVRPSDPKETSFLSSEEVSEVQEEEDKPPAVPPKSPRLINRSAVAPPNMVEAHLITPKNSNNSLRPRAATAMEIRPRRHIAELHRRNESTPIATVSKIHISRPNQRVIKLKHEAGESAMHCQDRSKRRRSLLGIGDRTSKTFAVEKTKFSQLPVGFTLPDAKSQFNSSDVEKLRKQAKTQAEKFKVLQYHEVKSLSKVSQP